MADARKQVQVSYRDQSLGDTSAGANPSAN
jgi:hypothetical protein